MFEKGLSINPAFAKNISVNYAILYCLQGMTDKGFESLEQAFQKGYKKDDTHMSRYVNKRKGGTHYWKNIFLMINDRSRPKGGWPATAGQGSEPRIADG
jgi:hypothetical protein